MATAVLEVISPGLGATIQDLGRLSWRRFGVPVSGVMDDHAARCANLLLENYPSAPVIEILLHGAELLSKRPVWIALTGADMDATHPRWRLLHLSAGEIVRFPRPKKGVWTYVAVGGGVDAPQWLGSASAYPRGGLGRPLQAGDLVCQAASREFKLPDHVHGRISPWTDQRNYGEPPPLRVWPGPQWDGFPELEQRRFFAQEWQLTSQSDRIGYRLAGEPLTWSGDEIVSEPVRVGTIQVPPSGQPIVTMRDGPTVGGYPKLGWIEPSDLSWLVQCQAGQKIRFTLCHEN